ncbi:unnamed protein product [Polarella glacialis]|uniref:CSD domain-containing protein n=1 Tax=Polarella glacialis TaxID=89957 RepID=A0A813FQF8_POLGL|nr:unnamed protein product [Polarella glacialis]
MALAVRRAYACPTCCESFTKWSLCQSHVHSSAPCREALGEKLRNLDNLQEICRVAAGGPANGVSYGSALLGPSTPAAELPTFSGAAVAAAHPTSATTPQSLSASSLSAAAAPANFDRPAAAAAAAASASASAPASASAAPQPQPAASPAVSAAASTAAAASLAAMKSAGAVLRQPSFPATSSSAGATSNSKAVRGGDAPAGSADVVLADAAAMKLDRAVQSGLLCESERRALDDVMETLSQESSALQLAAVSKFLSPGFGEFRWIADKADWLQRCLKFCLRTSSAATSPDPSSSPSAALIQALACHALLPDALAQECWNTFGMLPAELQVNVAAAAGYSLIMNVGSKVSEHFAHLCVNEEVIFNLQAKPSLEVAVKPAQVEWEAIDDTLYQRLLQRMLFRRRNAEERLLRDLAEADASGLQPGQSGSLLYVHQATTVARKKGSAEVLSLLHAAAACGLERLCARFISEGLDLNEQAGHQATTPLHLAAANGSVAVVELLLRMEADPNLLDSEGRSPLYRAVAASVDPLEQSDGQDPDAPVQHQLQFKVCHRLLMAGLTSSAGGGKDDVSEEEVAELTALCKQRQLWQMLNLLRLYRRLRELRNKFPSPSLVTDASIIDVCQLQYETACFVIAVFESHIQVNSEAAPIEFRAVLQADFVQARDQVQHLGNRLARRLALSRRAIDSLLNLPPQAALLALQTWKLEEIIPRVYEAHESYVPQGGNELGEADEAEDTTDALPAVNGNQRLHDEDTERPPEEEDLSAASRPGNSPRAPEEKEAEQPEEQKQQQQPEEEEAQGDMRYTGRVRKWDAERGFGFIVQDVVQADEVPKDVFVHRTSLRGNGTNGNSQVDLMEGCRISYVLGEQDDKPRAVDATMIDENHHVLPVHMPASKADKKQKEELFLDEEDELSQKFLRHLRSPAVVQEARERRPECEAWLRCVGLRRHNSGRREDTIWKKEIERRVDLFLEAKTTPLQKRDFDFRVRRFLNEFCMHGTVARVSEALALVGKYTTGKSRDDVRSWPAYLATLLRKFDPEIYTSLADRDRKTRIEQRRQKQNSTGDRIDGDWDASWSLAGQPQADGGGQSDGEEQSGSSAVSTPRNNQRGTAAPDVQQVPRFAFQ